jgi:hypothetical protein
MKRSSEDGWWAKLDMKYKILTGIMGFIILSAGTVQAWTFLGLPVIATQGWVTEVQYPIQQSLQGIIVGQKRGRISAVKDLLVGIEDKYTKASPSERARLDQQKKELNNEWSQLESEIQKMEAVRR